MLGRIDDLILSAGLENVSSFATNVLEMFEQELGALEACAEENAGIAIQCKCGYYLNQSVDGKLIFRMEEGYKKWYLKFHFECPRCDRMLAVRIVPFGMAEEVPF